MTSGQNRILIATSIAPTNLEKQRIAIDTWTKMGLEVVSLNNKDEINKISPFFPDINFHIVDRNAKDRFGKPYIYIYDFMQLLSKKDYEVCGIINSDICFKGVKKDFLNFVYKESLNSLVYGHRKDVNHINELNGEVCEGVDYFFFDKKLTSIYGDEGFCMGQPAWDYWMVAVPISLNIKAKRILNQVAYHQKHPQQWDEELNRYFTTSIINEKYIKKLYPTYNESQLIEILSIIVCCRNGIIYNGCNNSPSVLVVYNPNNCSDITSSKTYKSIENQSYPNIRIIKGNIENIKKDDIKEDYIYLIEEGKCLNNQFIELLINEIEDFDCIVANSENLNMFEELNNLDILNCLIRPSQNLRFSEKFLFRVSRLNEIDFNFSNIYKLSKKIYGFRNLYSLKVN